MTIPPCPHCHQTFSKQHHRHHIPICPWRPGYLPEVRQLIRDLSSSESSCTLRNYDRNRERGWKTGRVLVLSLGGSWANVLKWADVPAITCRHCQRVMHDAKSRARHEGTCMENADLANEVHSFFGDYIRNHGALMTSLQYESARPRSLPSYTHLTNHFGSWSAVTEWVAAREDFRLDEDDAPYTLAAEVYDAALCSASALHVVEGVRVMPAWHIFKKKYVPGSMQTVYMVR